MKFIISVILTLIFSFTITSYVLFNRLTAGLSISDSNIKENSDALIFNLEELTPKELELVKMIWRNRLNNHFKQPFITRIERDLEELGAILRTLSTRYHVIELIELDTIYRKMDAINKLIRYKRGIRGTVIEV